jgi:hypothetical protein
MTYHNIDLSTKDILHTLITNSGVKPMYISTVPLLEYIWRPCSLVRTLLFRLTELRSWNIDLQDGDRKETAPSQTRYIMQPDGT